MDILNKIKKPIIKETFLYTISGGTSKAISFLVLPLISNYLVPQELGMAANLDVLVSILSLLGGLAIVNGLPYFYYKRSKRDVAILISTLIGLVLLLNLTLSIVIFLLRGIIFQYLYLNAKFQLISILIVISLLLSNVNLITLRLDEKPLRYLFFNLSSTILYVLFLLYFVVYLRLEGAGKIYSLFISNVTIAIVHIVYLRKNGYLLFKIRKSELIELLKFGIPLSPHSLSFWIKSGLDKILLTTYCGLAINGLYSMAMSFGAIYSIFVTAFNDAFVPYLQKKMSLISKETEYIEKLNLVKLSYKIYSFFLFLYLLIVPLCWLIIKYILDEKYLSSFQFIPWILLSLTINAFYALVIQYPYSMKKTFGLGIITISGSIIQCILTFILIKYIGENGIKISLVLGSLITTIVVWWYSNKVYPMPWISVITKKIEKY